MIKITNKSIAQILYEIADILEMQNIGFKPRAYRRAAREVEEYPELVVGIKDEKQLEQIPGVGESIAEKIREISETGTCEYYEQLKKTIPADIVNLIRIEGVGPKTIKKLYDELGIKTIKDLEKAAKEKKIQKLEGFKEKSEENILKGIKSFRKRSDRFRLDEALHYSEAVVQKMKRHSATLKILCAGSLRRKKESIGDLDILIVSKDPGESMEYFTRLPDVSRVLGKGKTKATIEFETGLQADLRIIDGGSWGSALQYFTGDKAHNIKVRKIAIKKGYKLNEYGLFTKKDKSIAGRTEDEIYKKLGMRTPPPEMRRDSGEVEAAQRGTLPKLVSIKDIRGDFHMHTTFSDGINTVEEMAETAWRLGYKYVAITEHNTEGLEVAGGIDSKDTPKYVDEVKSKKYKVHVLVGLEVNVAKDGSLTVPDKFLKILDFVVIGVHSHFRMTESDMTKRILTAFENPYVNVFAHPTGRLLLKRDEYDFDFEAVCKKAREKNICLELNAHPERLDLDGEHSQLAKSLGCKFAIGTDSHSTTQLENIKYGVYMARRGWLEKRNVINTMQYNELAKFLKDREQ
ncbi:DNA polymerase/3'-5' exonuclease PolX [Candidatus Dojkabacteria bacterium]|nr:DNA polymerase/3'-5' exonuclease PolX [Candidatus Dojkabacteria bacterium]